MARMSAREYLQRWVQGTLRWSEERQLNAAAEEDPFLADAWEGLQSKPTGDHAQQLATLRAKLQRQRRRPLVFWVTRAAAAGLLLALAGWAYRFFQVQPSPVSVEITAAPKEDSLPAVAILEPATAADAPTPPAARKMLPNPSTTIATKPAAPAPAMAEEVAVGDPSPAVPSPEPQPEAAPFITADRAAARPTKPTWAPGKVRDEAGQPVAGAQILANDASWASGTDANGTFYFPTDNALLEVQVSAPSSNSTRTANLALNRTVVLAEPTPSAKISGQPTIQQARKAAAPNPSSTGPSPSGGWPAFYTYLQRAMAPNPIPAGLVVRFRLNGAGRPQAIEVFSPEAPAEVERVRQLILTGPSWQPATYPGLIYLGWSN